MLRQGRPPGGTRRPRRESRHPLLSTPGPRRCSLHANSTCPHRLCSVGAHYLSLGLLILSSLSRTPHARSRLCCARVSARAPKRHSLTQPRAPSPRERRNNTKDTFSFRSHTSSHDGGKGAGKKTQRHTRNAACRLPRAPRRRRRRHAHAESTTPRVDGPEAVQQVAAALERQRPGEAAGEGGASLPGPMGGTRKRPSGRSRDDVQATSR